jgi:hypothetical protein
LGDKLERKGTGGEGKLGDKEIFTPKNRGDKTVKAPKTPQNHGLMIEKKVSWNG